MKINNKEINIDSLIEDIYDDKNMIKKRNNNIYLSDNDIIILNRYDIDYLKFNSLKSLLFEIEEVLNEDSDANDLENLSDRLSELDYYNYTNK